MVLDYSCRETKCSETLSHAEHAFIESTVLVVDMSAAIDQEDYAFPEHEMESFDTLGEHR